MLLCGRNSAGNACRGHSISGMTPSPRAIYAGVGGQEVRRTENKRFRNGVVNGLRVFRQNDSVVAEVVHPSVE